MNRDKNIIVYVTMSLVGGYLQEIIKLRSRPMVGDLWEFTNMLPKQCVEDTGLDDFEQYPYTHWRVDKVIVAMAEGDDVQQGECYEVEGSFVNQ